MTFILTLTAATLALGGLAAPIPPAEKLLPDDTLAVVSAPDFPKLRDFFRQSPYSQLWRDPELKPFRDKFTASWSEEFVKPLARELNVRFEDYRDLAQGQVTFALTQNGWDGQPGQSLAWLLLLDAGNRSGQLKTNLANVRQKWVDAGKTLRTEKIRDVEFLILTLTSNDVPATLRKFAPERPPRVEPPPDSAEARKPESRIELAIAQHESLLIVASSTRAAEKIVARLTGGLVPSLAEVGAFEADQLAQFRDVPVFGWIHARAFVNLLGRLSPEPPPAAPGQPPPLDVKTLLDATGLSGLRTLAFSVRDTGEGSLLQFALRAPESARAGLFKVLATEAKDAAPPAFVPADAVKFQRLRLDGQKTWAAIEKMVNDISPHWLGVLNLLLQTADRAGKGRDPSFDVKKDLLANVGDDFLTWQKPPRNATLAELDDAPSLLLVGSPSPAKLAVSVRHVLAPLGAQPGATTEREFLGRKIYSGPLPLLTMPETPNFKPRVVHYAASGGHVAFSTDVALLEEYLRSADSPPKPLRETAGLAEAIEKAGGAGGGWLSYENEASARRALFEALKNDPGAGTNASLGSALPGPVRIVTDGKGAREWFDFGLLPPFEKVAKYFHFTVTSGGANVDGITFRVFNPTPPGLRKTPPQGQSSSP